MHIKRNYFFSTFAAFSDKPQARLGIVVAKRNVKHAVARNKLKRLIRESFRVKKNYLSGFDVVIVVKKNFGEENKNIPEFFKGIGE